MIMRLKLKQIKVLHYYHNNQLQGIPINLFVYLRVWGRGGLEFETRQRL